VSFSRSPIKTVQSGTETPLTRDWLWSVRQSDEDDPVVSP